MKTFAKNRTYSLATIALATLLGAGSMSALGAAKPSAPAKPAAAPKAAPAKPAAAPARPAAAPARPAAGGTGASRPTTSAPSANHPGASNPSANHPTQPSKPGGATKPGESSKPGPANKPGPSGSKSGPAGSKTRTVAGGKQVTTDKNGKVRDIHDAKRGMDVHHGLDGGRRVSVRRADGSRLVAERGRRGYVERGYHYGGHDYGRRAYYDHGHEYNRYYRGYGYRGLNLSVYAPGYYYGAGFYGWAYGGWASPIAYGWGWGGSPWLGFYGGFFSPFAAYPSASFWLTDYLLSQDLQAAYAAAGDNGGGGGVDVLANQPWTDTGTQIVQGQTYTINAGGTVNWAAGATCGPAGAGGPGPNFLAPRLAPHSLVGKIGNAGAPFAVGPHRTFVAPVSGELFLGMNDQADGYGDNSGAWQATISGPPGADAPQQASGSPALTEDVKQQIAAEVKAQLALENQEATQTAQKQDVDPGSSGIARLLSDGHSHVFVVGDGLDLTDSSGAECAVSEGDALAMRTPPPSDATAANLVVLASKGGKECQSGATVSVNLTDLQEMQNHLRESIDAGLKELQSKQGKGGLPAAPASALAAPTQSPYAAVAPPPDPQDATDIQQQAQQADQAEKEVTAAPSADGGTPIAPPASTAPTVSVTLGQSPDQVVAALGQPTRKADLAGKLIYFYKDMKVTFKGGKVTDVE